MLQLAAIAPQDSNLVRLYYDIGEKYLYNNTPKAKEYFFKTKELGEILKWNGGFYLFVTGYTEILK